MLTSLPVLVAHGGVPFRPAPFTGTHPVPTRGPGKPGLSAWPLFPGIGKGKSWMHHEQHSLMRMTQLRYVPQPVDGPSHKMVCEGSSGVQCAHKGKPSSHGPVLVSRSQLSRKPAWGYAPFRRMELSSIWYRASVVYGVSGQRRHPGGHVEHFNSPSLAEER